MRSLLSKYIPTLPDLANVTGMKIVL